LAQPTEPPAAIRYGGQPKAGIRGEPDAMHCFNQPHVSLMHKNKTHGVFLALILSLATTARLAADVVETKDGARIVGKVTKIDSGVVTVATTYAGKIEIKQAGVTTITTETPVAVRLASGTRLEGTITTADGGLQIAGPNGTLSTPIEKVAASWAAGDEDPAIVALRRHWGYEATLDVSGTSGNKNQLGTAGAFRATLVTPLDKLALYTSYDRQVTAGAKSADQFKAGVDYSDNFTEHSSWYVRDEGGFDRIKDIKIFNVAAAGYGFDFIKETKHLLTVRAGLAYRFENYYNPLTPDVSAAGLDLGLDHEYQFGVSKLINRLTYLPTFADFGNYRLTHESSYQVPLANPAWKLSVGISNDYDSRPGLGIKRLDTIYFTRLLLDWK